VFCDFWAFCWFVVFRVVNVGLVHFRYFAVLLFWWFCGLARLFWCATVFCMFCVVVCDRCCVLGILRGSCRFWCPVILGVCGICCILGISSALGFVVVKLDNVGLALWVV